MNVLILYSVAAQNGTPSFVCCVLARGYESAFHAKSSSIMSFLTLQHDITCIELSGKPKILILDVSTSVQNATSWEISQNFFSRKHISLLFLLRALYCSLSLGCHEVPIRLNGWGWKSEFGTWWAFLGMYIKALPWNMVLFVKWLKYSPITHSLTTKNSNYQHPRV